MRKLVAAIIPLMLMTAILAACVRGPNEQPAQSSETAGSSEEARQSETERSCEQTESETSEDPGANGKGETNTVKVYNVCDYGAKHGGLDDSAYIQAAIDACYNMGGVTVYLPAGTYTICNTLYKKANVSITGDGMWSTKLLWKGAGDSAMIDTSNEALWGTSIENLFFFASERKR